MYFLDSLGYAELRATQVACLEAGKPLDTFVVKLYDWYIEQKKKGYHNGGSFFDQRTFEWVFWMSK